MNAVAEVKSPERLTSVQLVTVHAAETAFPNWKEFNEMIGASGFRGRTDKDGPLWFMKDGKLVSRLSLREARALIADGTISGGMIPKIQTAIDAVEGGVNAAVILDGRIPHVLLLELFTEHGAGTLITAA